MFATEYGISTNTLSFSTSNWAIPQSILLYSIPELIYGKITVTITQSGGDREFARIVPSPIHFFVPHASLIVPLPFTLAPNVVSKIIPISLSRPPSSDVIVSVSRGHSIHILSVFQSPINNNQCMFCKNTIN